MPPPQVEFAKLLESLLSGSVARRRVVDKETFWLSDLEANTEGYAGSLFRIRSSDFGHLINPARPNIHPRPLDSVIPDGHEIGEMTVFFYCTKANALVIERNLHGVSAAGTCNFFETVRAEWTNPSLFPNEPNLWKPGSKETSIVFSPILQSDALEQLARFRCMHSIEVVCAGLAPGSEAQRRAVLDVPQNEVTKVAHSLEMDAVTITLSSKTASQSAMEFVRSWLPFIATEDGKGPKTRKLHIVGGQTPNDRETIDLVDRIIVEPAEITSAGRTATFHEKMRALDEAWRRRRDEVFDQAVRKVGIS